MQLKKLSKSNKIYYCVEKKTPNGNKFVTQLGTLDDLNKLYNGCGIEWAHKITHWLTIFDKFNEISAQDKAIIEQSRKTDKTIQKNNYKANRNLNSDWTYNPDGERIFLGAFIIDCLLSLLKIKDYITSLDLKMNPIHVYDVLRILICSRMFDYNGEPNAYLKSDEYLSPAKFKKSTFYEYRNELEGVSSGIFQYINSQLVQYGYRNSDSQIVLFDGTNTWFTNGVKNAFASKGFGKERKDKKIIQIAAAYDDNGIPICVNVYEGNKGEREMLLDTINQLHNDYGYKHLIIVADRGLSGANIYNTINDAGDMFVIMTKKPGCSNPIYRQFLKYRPFDTEKDLLDVIPDKNNKDRYIRRYAFDVFAENIKLTQTIDKKKEVVYDNKLSIIALRRQDKYDNNYNKFMKQCNDAKKIMDEFDSGTLVMPVKNDLIKYRINGKYVSDVDKYVSKNKCTKEDFTGTNPKYKINKVLPNKVKYDHIKAMLGVNVIVSNSDKITAEQAVKLYKMRDKAEEGFKIAKSYFSLHPIRNHRNKQIERAVFTVFIAVLLEKIIYLRVNEVEEISDQKIIDALRSYIAVRHDANSWSIFKGQEGTLIVDAIFRAFCLPPISHSLTNNDIDVFQQFCNNFVTNAKFLDFTFERSKKCIFNENHV